MKQGVLLKSVGAYLDDTGFHGLKYGMEVPDMAIDMAMSRENTPKEFFRVMSEDDLKKVKEFDRS